MKRHVEIVKRYRSLLPKHHLWVHLLQRIGFQVNPPGYMHFLDESLNRLLRAACKHASQANIESPVLIKMKETLAREAGKRCGGTRKRIFAVDWQCSFDAT